MATSNTRRVNRSETAYPVFLTGNELRLKTVAIRAEEDNFALHSYGHVDRKLRSKWPRAVQPVCQ